MKKALFTTLVIIFLLATAGWGADSRVSTALGDSPTSNQVTCSNKATTLKAATVPTSGTMGRVSIIFQNMSSPVTAVYISPRSDISVSNAGIVLDSLHGMSVTVDRSSGDVAWYCITASGTAVVGWTEEK